MKNTIKAFAIALVFASTQTFAGSTDDKMKRAAIEQALPETVPSIESPTPERNLDIATKKTPTAEQKAATVELSFKNSGK